MAAVVEGSKVLRYTEYKDLANVTIGADPELFLMNPQGKFISSVGKIGGSKLRPRNIGNGCAVQEDNVAVEFNIQPADTVAAFIESTNYALEYLTKFCAAKGLLLSVTASKVFDADQLDSIEASAFGCETDVNAWSMKPNKGPKADDPRLRTCGGHVHIGGIPDLDKWQLGRWCDLTIGLNSVLEDSDTTRRQLYGGAGAMRRKPYGIEYRVPSNYWLSSEELMEKVYNRAMDAVDRVMAGWGIMDDEGGPIINAINNSDKELAERLLAEYGVD